MGKVNGPYVTALGHAGLRIDAPGVRILADPWLSPGGAFMGSWFPFPDNAHLQGPVLSAVDVVVVSHEHLDHLDLDFLASLPAGIPVVVPRYPSTILERRLRGAGRENVVVLDAWERFPLREGGEDWLTVVPEQCPMSHDAAVLIKVAGRAILHTNDARISLSQARRAAVECGREIDLMGVQMSGASWHPVCYEYPPEERTRVETIKRIGKFKAVTRLLRSVKPAMVLPYAGPPCFLDPELFEHNSRLHGDGIFPDQDQAVGWLREHLPTQKSDYLLPGDVLDLGALEIERDPHWRDFDLATGPEERRRYLEEYAVRRRPFIDRIHRAYPPPPEDAELGARFAAHFASLGTLSSYFLARIGLVVRFQVLGAGGGTWDVHIGPDDVRVDLDGSAPEVNYRLRLESRWLQAVVSGRVRWEELLLSLRFTARREPDTYNDYLVGLLKHADLAALRAVERFEQERDPREMIDIAVPGGTVSVSRYCPHAGEDLAETGIVVDGVLRCLGHNFEFDLNTGECVNARCDGIVVAGARDTVSSTR